MLWDWECTYFEAEPGNPHGGGTVILGVAWFDQAFFDDRRDTWLGAMHTRIYRQLGIPLEAITVTAGPPSPAERRPGSGPRPRSTGEGLLGGLRAEPSVLHATLATSVSP